MPIYEFEAPNGKTLKVDGPRPPTEGELYGIFSAAYPDDASFQETVFERIGSAVGSAAQAAVGIPESGARYAANVIGRAGMLAAPAAMNLVGPLKALTALKSVTEEALPTLPQARESFITGDVPSAIGSLGAAVATGVVAGPAAALTTMFGAEAQDAYDAEMARQAKAGEERNTDKAMFKSIAYGAGATAIEYKLGAGYILRRIGERFGKEGAKDVADAVAKGGWERAGEVLKGAGKASLAGTVEETAQSALQQKIVEGEVNWKQALREGAAGAVAGGLAGGAVAAIPRPVGEPQPPVLENTPDEIVPATTEALGAVTGTPEATPEPEAPSEPITGVTEAVQRANAPSEAPLSTAAESAVAAETTTPTTGGTDGLREETRQEAEVTPEPPVAEATQTETPPALEQSAMAPGQITPMRLANERVASRSNWQYQYVPTANAPTIEWAKGQVDNFQGDLITAARQAVSADMTDDQKTVLLTEITERAAKRVREPMEEESNQLALRVAAEALIQIGSRSGQALQSQKVRLEKLTPYAPVISYVTQIQKRADRAVKRNMGDTAPVVAEIEAGFKASGDVAAAQLGEIIEGAEPTLTFEPPPAAAQQSEVKQALEELKQAASKLISLGAVGDGQQMAKDQVAVIAALFKLAKAAIKAGVKTVEDFAKLIGVKVSASVRKVWDQANAGDTPPAMEPAEIADMTKVVRAKYSQPERAAQSIINEFARIQSDTPSMRGSNQSAVRKAFQSQVQNPQSDEAFTSTLVELKVSPEAAARLVQLARREVISRQAATFAKDRTEAEKIISGERKTVARLLSKAGAEGGIDWQDLFLTSEANQQARQRELFAKVENDPKLAKLTQAEKRQLATALNTAWEKLRERVFKREFAKLVPLTTVKPADKEKISKKLPRLIQLINLGALDQAEFANALAPEYGVAATDSATVTKLKELAQQAQAQPEGQRRNKIYAEMTRVMDDAQGFSWRDALSGGDLWFAFVLMRIGTFANVLVGSGAVGVSWTLLMAADAALVQGKPRLAAKLLGAFMSGVGDGARMMNEIVLKGNQSMLPDYKRRVDELMGGKRKSGDILESLLRRGNWLKGDFVGFAAYTRRIMTYLDYIASQGARDAAMLYAAMSSGDQAKIDAADKRFDKTESKRAKAQARTELGPDASEAEVRAVARDILESGVSEDVREGAVAIGRRVAANADPTGLGGIIYRTVAGLPFWVKAPAGLAFLRSVLNVASNASEFVPGIGAATFYRSSKGFRDRFEGTPTGNVLGLDMPPEQRRLVAAAQIFGLGILAAGMAWATDDDEEGKERDFEISGGWRNITPVQAKELKGAGQKPYSIKIGDRWFDYRQTPMAPILAMIGAVRDNRRFDKEKWDEKTLADKVGYAWLSGVLYVKDIAAIASIATLFGANAGRTEEFSFGSLNRWAAQVLGRFAGGFVPSILKEVEDMVDPRMFQPEKDEALAHWVRNFPVIGKTEELGNRPALNFFGDEIELTRPPMRAFYTVEKLDPVYRFAAKWMGEGVFVPQAGKTAKVYDEKTEEMRKMTDAEYYEYSKAYGKVFKDAITAVLPDMQSATAVEVQNFYDKVKRQASKVAKAQLGMTQEEAGTLAE